MRITSQQGNLASQITGQAPGPAGIFPGYTDTVSVEFAWWPPDPTKAFTAQGVQYYNVYRNGIRIYGDGVGGAAAGVGVHPGGIAGVEYYPWYVDNNLSPGVTNTYTTRAVVGGVESPDSPVLSRSTLLNGPSVAPTAPTDPATWVQPFALPTGGTTWIVSDTTAGGLVAGTDLPAGNGKGNNHCGFQFALNGANIHGGDVIVLTAGHNYPTLANSGYTMPLFDGTNGWTYIISSQTPEYVGGGTLPAFSTYSTHMQLLPFHLTGMPAINATSGTLSSPWALNTGLYFVVFPVAGNLLLQGYEERQVLFTNGSTAIDWNPATSGALSNNLYPTNGIATFGAITGGNNYTNGTFNAHALTGGAGIGAIANITVAGGTVTAVTPSTPISGRNYVVADVLTATLQGGSGFSINVTSLGVNNSIATLGTLVGGSFYTNQTYTGLALTGGSGTGATADITVSGGTVTSVTVHAAGQNYTLGDSLTAKLNGGTGFSVPVATLIGHGAGLTYAATSTLIQVAYGNHVTEVNRPSMATLTYTTTSATNFGYPCITFPGSSTPTVLSKIRFVGISIRPGVGTGAEDSFSCGAWISWPNANGNSSAFGAFPIPYGSAPPDSIYFDRCLMGTEPGDPAFAQVVHGIGNIFCNHFYAHQCQLYGPTDSIHGVDTQALLFSAGGPVSIDNCYLSAGAENIIAGGIACDPIGVNNMVYRYNLNHKPLAWFDGGVNGNTTIRPAGTGYASFGYFTKNLFELKEGLIWDVHDNMFLNCATSNEPGYHGAALALGVRDQTAQPANLPLTLNCPFNRVADINLHDNELINCGTGFISFTGDQGTSSLMDLRIRYYNNRCLLNPPLAKNDVVYGCRLTGACVDHIIDHNTFIVNTGAPGIGTAMGIYFYSAPGYNNPAGNGDFTPNGYTNWLDRLTITNNIFACATGTTGKTFLFDGAPQGPGSFTPFKNITYDANLSVGDPATYLPGTLIDTLANVGFKNFQGVGVIPVNPDDWNVTTGTYSTASTTAGPIGAIIGATVPAINGTWWAPNSPWNAQITAGAFNNPMPNSAAVISQYQTVGQNVTNAFNIQSTSFTAGLIVAPAGQATTSWTFTYQSVSHTFPLIPATGAVATQLVAAKNWFAGIGDTDRSIDLYSTDTGQIYDLYPDNTTTGGNGPITLLTASVRPLNGSGWWNQANFLTLSSGTASGASQVGGSIKPSEWAAGVIPHALMGAYPNILTGSNPGTPENQSPFTNNVSFIYPARASDGSGSVGTAPGWLPEGARLQLDPSMTDAQLTAIGVPAAMLPVCHALQTYGWYCMDIDGNFSSQIKFLSTNPNSSPGFVGSYPGAANLPMALMAHIRWVHGPYIVGPSGFGTGVAVLTTVGQCSYTTNYGSPDGLVHVGDVVTIYPAYNYNNGASGGIQGFAPPGGRGSVAFWEGVGYKVLSVTAGSPNTFTLGTLAGAALTTCVAGNIQAYFTTNAPLSSIATATASGYLA